MTTRTREKARADLDPKTEALKVLDVRFERIAEFADGFVIATEDDFEFAGEIRSGIKAYEASVREFFDDDIATANKLHKSLTSKKKKCLDRAKAIDDHLRELQKDWERERLRAVRAAEEEAAKKIAEAAAERGPSEFAQVMPEGASVPAKVKSSTSTTVKVWQARVINKAAVPDEYKEIRQKALDDLAKATKGKAEVPGVEFFEDVDVRRK